MNNDDKKERRTNRRVKERKGKCETHGEKEIRERTKERNSEEKDGITR